MRLLSSDAMGQLPEAGVGEHYGRAGVGRPPAVGLHLLLGPDFGRMFANQVRNLEEDRVRVVMGVWERA